MHLGSLLDDGTDCRLDLSLTVTLIPRLRRGLIGVPLTGRVHWVGGRQGEVPRVKGVPRPDSDGENGTVSPIRTEKLPTSGSRISGL